MLQVHPGVNSGLEIGCGWGRAKPQRCASGSLFREVSHPTKETQKWDSKKSTDPVRNQDFYGFLGRDWRICSEISGLGLSNYLASKGAKVTGDGCRAQVARAWTSDVQVWSHQSRWQELFNCFHSWAPLRVWKFGQTYGIMGPLSTLHCGLNISTPAGQASRCPQINKLMPNEWAPWLNWVKLRSLCGHLAEPAQHTLLNTCWESSLCCSL